MSDVFPDVFAINYHVRWQRVCALNMQLYLAKAGCRVGVARGSTAAAAMVWSVQKRLEEGGKNGKRGGRRKMRNKAAPSSTPAAKVGWQ